MIKIMDTGHSNLMTSRSLARLGEIGGPCCSKGNSYMSFLFLYMTKPRKSDKTFGVFGQDVTRTSSLLLLVNALVVSSWLRTCLASAERALRTWLRACLSGLRHVLRCCVPCGLELCVILVDVCDVL